MHPLHVVLGLSPTDYRAYVKTDGHHGAAWGAHDYFGKVRLSDGYVVLYRRPVRFLALAFPATVLWNLCSCSFV